MKRTFLPQHSGEDAWYDIASVPLLAVGFDVAVNIDVADVKLISLEK